MAKPSELLLKVIDKNYQKISEAFLEMESSYVGLIDILRQADVFWESIQSDSRFDAIWKKVLSERYNYGWFLPATILMNNISNNQEFFSYTTGELGKQWADSAIQVCGKLELSKRFIDLERANLIDIEHSIGNEFLIVYKNKLVDVEHYERLSFEFIQELAFESKKEKFAVHLENYPAILKEIKKIVKNPGGQFISYVTTPEIDAFYSKLGYFHLIGLQGYEEFGEDDVIGGINYKYYLDFIEDLAGVALKHRDCCYSLLEDYPKTDSYNIFTYTWHLNKTIEDYADHFETTYSNMAQIISCVTLSKENIEYYREDAGFKMPPFFHVGNNILIRSLQGSLYGSVNFLKRELKRRFPTDYFKAVNNRESRFRKDLYIFFPGDRLIKVDKEVIIKGDSYQTDIDAILFDKKTRTLGIFQLKWQDAFGNSIRERYSRISNMYPKSVEWIEKVLKWLSTSSKKDIISKFGLNKEDANAETIGEVFIFVIARNHVHFTGQELDDRAAWASWHQLVHSFSRVKTTFDDPIRELYMKLKFDSPSLRAEREGYPQLHPFEIELEDYKLSYLG